MRRSIVRTPDEVARHLPVVPPPVRAASLPQRQPGVATPLAVPDHALDAFFQSLALTEADTPHGITRVLHWGDSTIAADGITSVVRRRMRERFGDGGPGFLAAAIDPVWTLRPGLLQESEGWEMHTIVWDGDPVRRCGLAGTAALTDGEATSRLAGRTVGDDRQLLHRFELFYRAQPDGGTIELLLDGERIETVRTASDDATDQLLGLEQSGRTLTLHALGDGPVTVYGAVLETNGPGITWETFGLAGVSVWNLLQQERHHFRQQIAHRSPDLLVLQIGGNALPHPSLRTGEGARYARGLQRLLERLRSAAPEASCLLIGPLDQAVRERTNLQSHPLVERVIRIQRAEAAAAGCAFWDARAVMGGVGGFERWLEARPQLAWTDLMHLTSRGLDLVGESFTDALLAAYDSWSRANPTLAPLLDELPGSVARPASESEGAGASSAPGRSDAPGYGTRAGT
jgi:lysophospholipase L1-like esterase